MQYDTFLQKMAEAGDAYVYYTNAASSKRKYLICTLEIEDNAYIREKRSHRPNMPDPQPGYVRVFSWDLNDFKNVNVSTVTEVVPLATVMRYTK